MAREVLTDEQIEAEIERLKSSPLVALGKKEQQIKYRRRRYLYQLHWLEDRGRKLQESGITIEMLENLELDTDLEKMINE